MTGGCHNNPLIFWAGSLWFSAHIWRMTSELTLNASEHSASFRDVTHAGEQFSADPMTILGYWLVVRADE